MAVAGAIPGAGDVAVAGAVSVAVDGAVAGAGAGADAVALLGVDGAGEKLMWDEESKELLCSFSCEIWGGTYSLLAKNWRAITF